MTISQVSGILLAPASSLVEGPADKRENANAMLPDDGSMLASQPYQQTAAQTTGHGGLLLPTTAANLLKLANGSGPSAEVGATPYSPSEWLERNMKIAAAYSGDVPAVGNSNYYTQQDLDTIKAATGYNLVVMYGANGDGGTAIVDDNGNPPPDGVGQQVSLFAATIASDRARGALTGEVTPDYLSDVFARFRDANQPLPDDWLQKAIDDLQSNIGDGKSTSSTDVSHAMKAIAA